MIETLLSLYFVYFGISWIIGMIAVSLISLVLYRYEEKLENIKSDYTNTIRLKHIIYSLLIGLFNPLIYYIIILGVPVVIILFLFVGVFELLAMIWNAVKDIRIIK